MWGASSECSPACTAANRTRVPAGDGSTSAGRGGALGTELGIFMAADLVGATGPTEEAAVAVSMVGASAAVGIGGGDATSAEEAAGFTF